MYSTPNQTASYDVLVFLHMHITQQDFNSLAEHQCNRTPEQLTASYDPRTS